MDQKLIDQLRKLLTLSQSKPHIQSEATDHEAQAAAMMLQRLLAKHNLDIADLEKRGAASAPGVIKDHHDLGKAAFKWKLTLAEAIAEFYFCHPMVDWDTKTVAFLGRPDNVESLRMLYGWLIDQIRRASTQEWRAHHANGGEHIDPLRWQCGFGEGATRRLHERLREQRTRESSEAGTAMVLSRNGEISDWLEEHHGYRVDGRKTKRQQAADERYAIMQAEWEQRRKAKEVLLASDPDEYYRQYPNERPEVVAARRAKEEKEAEEYWKRQERNARRRKGKAYYGPSAEELRKQAQKLVADDRGAEAANSINLTPFLPGGKKPEPVSAHSQDQGKLKGLIDG